MSNSQIDDYDFSTGEAGASSTIPMEAGQIKKGGYIMIKGQPCKVIDISTSKTGKHGHAKCNFTATNIFNNKKLEDIVPSTHTTTVPVVSRQEYTLIDIDEEEYVSLMDDAGEIRSDIQLPTFPDDYANKIKEIFNKNEELLVTVLKACDNEQIISYKES